MPDQGNQSPARYDDQIDSAVLDLLVENHPGLWAVEEIERMIGVPLATYDSLRRLQGMGLVHRLKGDDRFVFASRAGVRGRELGEF